MGNVQLPAPCGDLVIVAQTNTPPAFLRTFARVATGSGTVCDRAASLGRAVYVADVATDAAFAPFRAFAQSIPFTSVLSTPLLTSSGTSVGVMSAHSKNGFAPSELELDALRDFSIAFADRLAAWGTGTGLTQLVRTLFQGAQPGRCCSCACEAGS